ncbi:MAG: hypothetical protein JWP82_773 [Humibacillus sp.]|nr:hypothetical protein [Humibacillus sp.]
MAMTEQDEPVSRAASEESTRSRVSSWGPGERAEGVLAQPVSRGLALGLTALVLAAGAGGLWAQRQALERVETSVSQTGDRSTGAGLPVADPELCWLIGTDAFAAGHGPQLLRAVGSAPVTTECWTAVRQGAQGLPRS